MNIEHTIRTLQGADFHFEPDPEVRYPGLIILGLCVLAWAAFIGAGYAIWRAVEALAG
jgi:hypothetical protein